MYVLPGDETGAYHITVGNLPWPCSWQKLKAFARNQDCKGNCINVEHVEVFSNSACGWVRIGGKSDFLKALEYLNGGIMDNRSLIADGRNETETIFLRDPGNISPQWNGSNVSSKIGRTKLQQRVSKSAYPWYSSYAPSSPMSTTLSTPCASQPLPVYENNQPPVEPQYDYYTPTPPGGIVYTGEMVLPTPVFIPQQCEYMNFQHQFQQAPVEMLVVNIQRKVVITQIPHSESKFDLRKLLHIATNDPYQSLQSLQLKKNTDVNRKSHAFVVFPTYEMAKAVVEHIDGCLFQGYQLKAKLAKEGAEAFGSYRQRQPRTGSMISPSASLLECSIRGTKTSAGGLEQL